MRVSFFCVICKYINEKKIWHPVVGLHTRHTSLVESRVMFCFCCFVCFFLYCFSLHYGSWNGLETVEGERDATEARARCHALLQPGCRTQIGPQPNLIRLLGVSEGDPLLSHTTSPAIV